MKKNTTNTPGSFSNLFEQAAQITKAHGFDILSEQVGELKVENEKLRQSNKELLEALKKVHEISSEWDSNSNNEITEITKTAINNQQ